jgi:GT2 family glycosyltransferase
MTAAGRRIGTRGQSPLVGEAGAHSDLAIGIGIATVGRPDILREVVRDIGRQIRLPDRIIICHSCTSDVAGMASNDVPGGIVPTFLTCTAGLPRQRNAILDAAGDLDVLLFIDDDFLMAPNYVQAVCAALAQFPDLVAATGELIHDDVKGPGIDVATGRSLIDTDLRRTGTVPDMNWRAAPHAYGCNMALRLATVRAHALRFDERLPLYGWSEDIDFTHRLARYGTIAKLAGARGVHLGVKQGRTPGRRLGYSQVANPFYLLRKGSYSVGRATRSVARNIAANGARALWPEPYIDRRGRLLGNLLALLDMCRGRMRPERILEL